MITATVEVNQVRLSEIETQISQEVIALTSDKEAIAKILSWDSCGTIQYSPSEIESISYKGDILRFNLSGNRATMLSVNQLFYYHQQIMESEKEIIDAQEISHDEIVALAKEIGTEVWEHGCKLGYVLQYRAWFYAVTSILTPRGFEYSYCRCSSFYLAHSELIERSWEVEVRARARRTPNLNGFS